MNTTNIKAAFRSLLKSKLQSVICVTGMGIGMGSVILIGLLAIHEYSFDRYIPNFHRVFRVTTDNDVRSAYPLLDKALAEIPAVEKGFRFMEIWEIGYRDKNNTITLEEAFCFADPGMFDCLGLSFKQGKAADNKNGIAISEEMAKKHFGDSYPVGETMFFNLNGRYIPLTITGVYKNIPSNSSIEANYVAHIDLAEELSGNNSQMLGIYGQRESSYFGWDNIVFTTYLVLNDPDAATSVEQKISGYSIFKSNQNGQPSICTLQPVKEIYLRSGNLNGNSYARSGNPNDLYYYLAISLLIFTISLINFVVLTRARTNIRAGEIGTKKAMGAQPNQIRSQIVAESFLMILLSIVPAILLLVFGVPFINKTLGQNIDFSVFSRPETWATLLLVFASSGLISGFLIGHRISIVPIPSLLRGSIAKNPKNRSWGNSILIVHFAIFILLVSSVVTLEKQIRFALTNFSAIDPENILVYELNTPELSSKFGLLKSEIEKIPGTLKVAGSSFVPPFNNYLPISLADTSGQKVRFDGLIMGDGMAELLGMEFIWGGDFDEFQPNQTNVIFNESAEKAYGVTEEGNFLAFKIKGVVKDFNAHSLHTLIQPMAIIQQNPLRYSLIAIKTDGKNDKAIKERMEGMLLEMGPDQYVDGYYLTDQISGFYRTEERQSSLVKAFALLAIILSVMGLFGMVANTATRKTREIGIRKVNGAKVTELMVMLNLGFIKWIVLSFLVATPIAIYAMEKWLRNFAYRTELNWWIFAAAGIFALAITLLTVSWQSWRAATRNPVESLRYE